MKTNKRNPSKHRIEEHDYLNHIKYNPKIMKVEKQRRYFVWPAFIVEGLAEEATERYTACAAEGEVAQSGRS